MKKIRLITVLALILSAGLVGFACNGEAIKNQMPTFSPQIKNIYAIYDVSDTHEMNPNHIQIVIIEDNIRCAVVTGYRESGIDCDWPSKTAN